MAELGGAPERGVNIPEMSVSELSMSIKRTVEDAFGYVRVRGEVGRVSRPGSGHVYLDLKDEKSVLNGVIWRGSVSRLQIQPEQGLEVVVTGKLTTFPGQSRYQIVIDSMAPAGVGALMALLEERKKKFAAEGLFAEERKKPLPFLPEVIGVVISPSGAVIRDILHRLSDRFPRHVLIWPTLVQGEKAAEQITAAIKGFNAMDSSSGIPRPDLIIVARGGGSIEDLWPFNEENVVRAASESAIPLISAVGHETDTTLIDYVSDRRAPTPTAAAEMAVPVRSELMANLNDLNGRLMRGASRLMDQRTQRLNLASRGLPKLTDLLSWPRQRLDNASSGLVQGLMKKVRDRQIAFAGLSGRMRPEALGQSLGARNTQLQDLEMRLMRATASGVRQNGKDLAFVARRLRKDLVTQKSDKGREQLVRSFDILKSYVETRLTKLGSKLETHGKMLEALSYERTLDRGYALVRNDQGKLVRSAGSVHSGAKISVEFSDGPIGAIVEGDGPLKGAKKPAAKKKPAGKKESDQGSLF